MIRGTTRQFASTNSPSLTMRRKSGAAFANSRKNWTPIDGRQHRAHPDIALTAMCNVLERLRAGEELSDKDRAIHENGLVSVLRKLHDDLDATVLDAYGWPHDLTDEQIVGRLVALNAQRAAEEERGVVRWLRPDFQQGEAKPSKPKQVTMPGVEPTPTAPAASAAQWPKTFSDRIVSVRSALSSRRAWSAREMAERFKSAGKRAPKKADVEEILEGLRALGLALRFEERGESKWAATARSD